MYLGSGQRAPKEAIGSGVGEYSRKKLSPEQEDKFALAVDEWVNDDWLVEHDEDVHGKPLGVLPLIAVMQEHKPSTPVRPVLDYRELNNRLLCNPGMDTPVGVKKKFASGGRKTAPSMP